MDTVDRQSCAISLTGAIVRQAIIDAYDGKDKQRTAEKKDAIDFLESNRLETFFKFWGHDEGTAYYTRRLVKKTMGCKHKNLTLKHGMV